MVKKDWIKEGMELAFDYERRAPLALNLSLAYNLLYALFKLAAGIFLGSFWMIALACYYGCLAVMRFLLLLHLSPTDERSAWKSYKNTGILLLVLTIIISGIVGQTYILNKTYDYPGVLIYAFAAFAFGKIITVTRTLFKRRHEPNIILKASRCISFAHALMSIMALQIALINRFGGDNPNFARLMNGLLGGAIFLIIHFLAIYMIRRGRLGMEVAQRSGVSSHSLTTPRSPQSPHSSSAARLQGKQAKRLAKGPEKKHSSQGKALSGSRAKGVLLPQKKKVKRSGRRQEKVDSHRQA